MPGQNPYAHSTFVGRERERSALLDALRTRRLVSLTGPGGIGKTRLAREVSAEAAGKFAHGTHWADLGPVRDAGQLLTEVARAVGLADQSSRPRAEALCAYLARQRCLLVLDSGEQVWDAVRDLAGDLLTACPGLTVLISARRPLELVEEYVWTLGPLPEDGPEAFALFAEGGAAVRPGGLAPGERAVAARICARLEGIPLALELAAARAARLPLDELARRLESRLDTLVAERQADPGTEWHGGIGAEWPEVIHTEWQEGPGPRATGAAPTGTARCGPRSAGATSCASRRTGCSGHASPSSGDPSTSRPRARCAPGVRSRGGTSPPGSTASSPARCCAGTGAAGRCSTRSPSTAPSGWSGSAPTSTRRWRRGTPRTTRASCASRTRSGSGPGRSRGSAGRARRTAK
ncbi:AAA family ATPase [Streptomyces sp. NEAU-H3]|uniref:AAA family ATPase n=1 Tax=Streptomyces sp. NEAU-H3 TaxID=2720636 RepID=UPI001FD77746|nr:AAA family ATPase [Streptomyces sp. NEAU-H3]